MLLISEAIPSCRLHVISGNHRCIVFGTRGSDICEISAIDGSDVQGYARRASAMAGAYVVLNEDDLSIVHEARDSAKHLRTPYS